MTSAARAARGHWTTDARTDALARVCPASAPSKDDVGPDNALQPGLLSASWAAPKYFVSPHFIYCNKLIFPIFYCNILTV
jgi:hypothetical protein